MEYLRRWDDGQRGEPAGQVVGGERIVIYADGDYAARAADRDVCVTSSGAGLGSGRSLLNRLIREKAAARTGIGCCGSCAPSGSKLTRAAARVFPWSWSLPRSDSGRPTSSGTGTRTMLSRGGGTAPAAGGRRRSRTSQTSRPSTHLATFCRRTGCLPATRLVRSC